MGHFARFAEFVLTESEASGAAAGGYDDHVMARGSGGPKGLSKIVLNVTALKAELPGE